MRVLNIVGFVGCLTLMPLLALPATAASDQDKSFINTAMQETSDLQMLAGLAAKKISDARVRDFARTIAQSSNTTNATLTEIARRDDVKPPGALSIRASDQYSRIDAQSGKDAADEFLRDIAIDARISQDDYSNEAQSGADPMLKRLASQRSSDLERIARQADSLRSTLR